MTHGPTSPAPPLPAPSLAALLRDRSVEGAERELLRFEGRSLTVGDVERRSRTLAARLAARGVGRGDRVAIMLPNGLDYPLVWLAVVRLGGVVVPCNTSYQRRDLAFVLADSGARLLVTDAEHLAVVGAARPDCPALESVALIGEVPAASAATPLDDGSPADRPAEPDLGPDDLATLQYTSGTTGFPKGCMLSHEYWLRLADSASRGLGLGDGDVVMIMTPWYYMDAAWNMVLCLIHRIPLVILPRFSASGFWTAVVENGVTFFYCLGTIPIVLLKQPANPALERGHRVKAVVCSAIPPTQHHAIEARFGCPWREAYSTTEIGPVCLTVPLEDDVSVGTGAMGRPAPGCEARVVGPDGSEVARGATGELQMRGPGTMLGYWNNPEATEAWRAGGWAHTGDLVVEDERGYFRIVGRLKEMIRRGGENIAAAEVEAVLAEHPAVRLAACVPAPDEIRGEEVKAFVQLVEGAGPDTAPPEALLAHCRSRLAPFKVPRYLAYAAALPLTPSQRVEKHRLSREPAGAYDAVTGAWI